MKTISVSTNVFARIWALRQQGEETEDAILQRELRCPARPEDEQPVSEQGVGFRDARFGVVFPEGFEISRVRLGTSLRAQARGGAWVLEGDGRRFDSLNQLSTGIGAKGENAWKNWFFVSPDGKRSRISDLRDPTKIGTRRRGPTPEDALAYFVKGITEKNRHAETDWGAPVGKEAW